MVNSDQHKKLCTQCIGNEDLIEYIEDLNERGRCDFIPEHGNKNYVISISDFCAYYDEYFRERYGLGEQHGSFSDGSDRLEYDTFGEMLIYVVQDDALTADEEVAEAIVKGLIKNENCDFSRGEEAFYNEYANYESLARSSEREQATHDEYWYEKSVEFKWHNFCHEVIYGRRFFNIQEQLDNIFGHADSYTEDGRRCVYTLDKGGAIYRARKLGSRLNEADAKNSPAENLGAPPAELSAAGRMNVRHIPVFYGAFSPQVAVAELQPYISELLAVGKFTLTRDIRVFDFTVFDRIFDEKYEMKGKGRDYDHTRYTVISHMQEEISKPVLIDNKDRDYIPTQILTEYIQEQFQVDAIIYFSSLFKRKPYAENNENNPDIRNIALLNRPFSGNFKTGLSIDSKDIAIKVIKNVTFEIENKPFFPL